MCEKEQAIIDRYQLSWEGMIALLQGKDAHFHNLNGKQVIIKSPQRGVFLTHEQIFEIQNEAQCSLLGIMDRLGMKDSVDVKEGE